jgi:hypothetical protein
LQFHNSADSTTVMNALLHSSLYADPLLANDRRGLLACSRLSGGLFTQY